MLMRRIWFIYAADPVDVDVADLDSSPTLYCLNKKIYIDEYCS